MERGVPQDGVRAVLFFSFLEQHLCLGGEGKTPTSCVSERSILSCSWFLIFDELMHMRFFSVCIGTLVCLLNMPRVFAHPVISEVMWAGSDLSSSDEWFELTLPPCEAAPCEQEDLAGYTITYLKSTGIETVMFTFPSNSFIQPGEVLLVSHFDAENSRLLSEPAFVTSSMTLANTGLRLRLKDAAGAILDEVDDGVGVPFTGANPSAPGAKASMERIDLLVSGTLKENWRTASTTLGLDAGANMLATPGYPNSASLSSSSSSVSSSSSSSSSQSSFESSAISVSSDSSSSVLSEPSLPTQPSSPPQSPQPPCTSDLSVDILLQSGEYSGISKVTLNVQAVATSGTLAGAACFFDFGDGYTSSSCNPPVHSYAVPGVFTLAMEVKNQCDTTLIQTRTVTVTQDEKQSTSANGQTGTSQVFDDAKIIISGILPNPDEKDEDKEWIELKNLEDHEVSLTGWHLAVGEKTVRRFAFESIRSIAASASVRLYQSETGISLTNAAGKVELLNPQGVVVSSVHWEKALEGIVYKSDSFKNETLTASVDSVIDSENLRVTFDGPSSRLIGQDDAIVRLIGVTGFGAASDSELLSVQTKAFEIVSALLEKKKIELFFDSEVWDTDGSLLAYVMLDDGRILQKELLLSGFAIADTSSAYRARQEFIDAQKKAVLAGSGIWSFVGIPEPSFGGGAQEENKKVVLLNDTSTVFGSGSFPKILITEVFPSPSPKEESGSLVTEEWIEFLSLSPSEVILKDWQLRIGKKSVVFGPSSILESGKHTVLFVSQVGLKLRNDGDEIELLPPDGSARIFLAYPKVKPGYSYVYDESAQSYCMSKNQSGGSRGSCAVSNPDSNTTATASKPKTSKPRASVYDKYAASYRAGLQGDENTDSIILGTESSRSTSSMLLIAFLGLILGCLGSILALKLMRNPWFIASN